MNVIGVSVRAVISSSSSFVRYDAKSEHSSRNPSSNPSRALPLTSASAHDCLFPCRVLLGQLLLNTKVATRQEWGRMQGIHWHDVVVHLCRRVLFFEPFLVLCINILCESTYRG